MKLSKLLLGAILAGITVHTNSSCNKKDKEVNPQTNTEQGSNVPQTPPVDPCPACGMG